MVFALNCHWTNNFQPNQYLSTTVNICTGSCKYYHCYYRSAQMAAWNHRYISARHSTARGRSVEITCTCYSSRSLLHLKAYDLLCYIIICFRVSLTSSLKPSQYLFLLLFLLFIFFCIFSFSLDGLIDFGFPDDAFSTRMLRSVE
jgi:hypothetical protein